MYMPWKERRFTYYPGPLTQKQQVVKRGCFGAYVLLSGRMGIFTYKLYSQIIMLFSPTGACRPTLARRQQPERCPTGPGTPETSPERPPGTSC